MALAFNDINVKKALRVHKYLVWDTCVKQVATGRARCRGRRRAFFHIIEALSVQQCGDGAGVEQVVIVSVFDWKTEPKEERDPIYTKH